MGGGDNDLRVVTDDEGGSGPTDPPVNWRRETSTLVISIGVSIMFVLFGVAALVWAIG